MKSSRLFYLLLLLATLFVSAVFPADAADGVQVSLTADRDSLTVGDVVHLILEVTHPTGQHVIIPELEPVWGDFEVREQSGSQVTANPDGTETTSQQITLSTFETGRVETPILTLKVETGNGQADDLIVPPVTLEVKSVLAEGDTNMKDIRPQAVLPATPPWTMIGLATIFAMVTVGGGLWLAKRWRGGSLRVDNRLPYQVALDELAAIEKLGLLEQRNFKKFYTLVTDSLRQYLEKQFQLQATDRTTAELNHEIAFVDIAPDHSRQFINLFSDADFVKFARITPEIEDGYQFIQAARALVEITGPQPDPVKSKMDQPIDTRKHVEVTQ
jgi:hypothetical protein